ncbi:peptide deformylase [Sodaliphilus sp.]|uniref:peptide deformylase n=1 Tax=Sodaliphilus sp. TaxID=2815818 RepID=UPI00388DC7D3
MVLPIYLYGHPVLRKVAEEVTPEYPALAELIANMKDTMYASDGIGIAAPQVGVSIKLVYIDVDVLGEDMPELKGVNMVLINPEVTVIEDGNVTQREEGCLSLPGIHESVKRTEKINLKWTDENWEQHEQVIEGYLARVVQHECDHLDGKVFIDHVSPIRKQLNRSKLNNIIKGNVRCHYRTRGFKPLKK